jgi:mono/diheme cytochrome c family protein
MQGAPMLRARTLLAAATLSACGEGQAPMQPLTLAGGTVISAERLEHGREKYTLYCRACHGDKGDGRGPAGIGLRPPPRNFTDPTFKFGGVEAGSLPPDAELIRIVKGGLAGTAMLPWQIPDADLADAIQYIKTFSPVWGEDEPGVPVEIGEDPWKGKEQEAVAKGKIVYHGLAQCLKCHPAYATKQEIWDATKEATGEGSTSAFREGMYFPEAKYSDAYKYKILPPDFTRHTVRSGNLRAQVTPTDLFRTIASGIGGTAMPMWKGSIEDADIWAIAYFVDSLIRIKDTPEAEKLRNDLLNQPEWTPPPPADAPPVEGQPPPP